MKLADQTRTEQSRGGDKGEKHQSPAIASSILL
jgi:hypothetical protein